MVECLECGAEIHVPEDAGAGDMVACRVCGESFAVIAIGPVEIDYPDDDEAWEDETWEDDDQDDDDDWDEEAEADAPPVASDAVKEDSDDIAADIADAESEPKDEDR